MFNLHGNIRILNEEDLYKEGRDLHQTFLEVKYISYLITF